MITNDGKKRWRKTWNNLFIWNFLGLEIIKCTHKQTDNQSIRSMIAENETTIT